eukprot:TRINITY_DN8838_c0_g1_i5.p3 TRINITY_DN8838_c0_g1~~TRINITY_DN8838_c0_g1_i5.p3  ORF type:complete len:101 (+),score=16.23 TRINITY_DN8838_c0_g1_i5:341-643(+)
MRAVVFITPKWPKSAQKIPEIAPKNAKNGQKAPNFRVSVPFRPLVNFPTFLSTAERALGQKISALFDADGRRITQIAQISPDAELVALGPGEKMDGNRGF